jgi:hypothetical protein
MSEKLTSANDPLLELPYVRDTVNDLSEEFGLAGERDHVALGVSILTLVSMICDVHRSIKEITMSRKDLDVSKTPMLLEAVSHLDMHLTVLAHLYLNLTEMRDEGKLPRYDGGHRIPD